jgi:acetyltransferase-like isoleucine patch superfamily enzyme
MTAPRVGLLAGTRDVREGVFAAGNPCRIIREITG